MATSSTPGRPGELTSVQVATVAPTCPSLLFFQSGMGDNNLQPAQPTAPAAPELSLLDCTAWHVLLRADEALGKARRCAAVVPVCSENTQALQAAIACTA